MRLSRRNMCIAIAGLTIASMLPAAAFQSTKFTPAALAAAQKSGNPVLVEIHASWCPTCKAQAPTLDRLLGSEKFKAFRTLAIDFDTQKTDVQALNANMQSTLIVFKGNKEVGRSVGVTDPAAIEALLAKAL